MTTSRPALAGPMPKDVPPPHIPGSRVCVWLLPPCPRSPGSSWDFLGKHGWAGYQACLSNKALFEALRVFLHDKNMGDENDWIHLEAWKQITRSWVLKGSCSDLATLCGLLWIEESFLSENYWNFKKRVVGLSDLQATRFRYIQILGAFRRVFTLRWMGMQNIMQIRFNLLDDLPQYKMLKT